MRMQSEVEVANKLDKDGELRISNLDYQSTIFLTMKSIKRLRNHLNKVIETEANKVQKWVDQK